MMVEVNTMLILVVEEYKMFKVKCGQKGHNFHIQTTVSLCWYTDTWLWSTEENIRPQFVIFCCFFFVCVIFVEILHNTLIWLQIFRISDT